jgi:hypothetical protein
MTNPPFHFPRHGAGRGRAWSLGSVLTLSSVLGCHPPAEGIKGTQDIAEVASVDEAQAIVDDARKQHGMTGAGVAPQSLAEVKEVLRRDQSERFIATRDYLASLDGLEALALRATLESLWAEGQLLVADLAREHARRRDGDVATTQQILKLQPGDSRLQARIEEARRQAARERRLAQALTKLSEPHYESALSLAREVVRRDRTRADGYGTLANLYRLHGEWSEFERNLLKAEAQGDDRVVIRYARAMERVERIGDRDGAKQALEALLAEHADIARARARLVLLEDDVHQRHEQLKKLERINPNHALIALEGAAIEREYQAENAARGAQTGAESSAVAPPSATLATP